MKISVVIPVYNEEKRIKKTADVLVDYLGKTFEDYEIIFSNDGSFLMYSWYNLEWFWLQLFSCLV